MDKNIASRSKAVSEERENRKKPARGEVVGPVPQKFDDTNLESHKDV